MTYYIAYSQFYPITSKLYPLRYKTEVIEGVSPEGSLSEIREYLSDNPKIFVQQYNMTSSLWGDPLAFPTVGITQTIDTWVETPLSHIRLKWDIYTCDENGLSTKFIGDIITPLSS